MGKRRNIDFEGLYGEGIRPGGPIFQTANGTARPTGLGQNQNPPSDYWPSEAIPGGAWQKGRNNRTGE